MKWEEVASDWPRFAPLLKSKWSKLTDEDLASLSAERERLADVLERLYGIQKKYAEMQADRWLAELKPAAQAGTGGNPS